MTMCPPEGATWWQRVRHGWSNAFYRNSMVYCMVVLTINALLNFVPLVWHRCAG